MQCKCVVVVSRQRLSGDIFHFPSPQAPWPRLVLSMALIYPDDFLRFDPNVSLFRGAGRAWQILLATAQHSTHSNPGC